MLKPLDLFEPNVVCEFLYKFSCIYCWVDFLLRSRPHLLWGSNLKTQNSWFLAHLWTDFNAVFFPLCTLTTALSTHKVQSETVISGWCCSDNKFTRRTSRHNRRLLYNFWTYFNTVSSILTMYHSFFFCLIIAMQLVPPLYTRTKALPMV